MQFCIYSIEYIMHRVITNEIYVGNLLYCMLESDYCDYGGGGSHEDENFCPVA